MDKFFFFSETHGGGKGVASLSQLAKDVDADTQEFVACLANNRSPARINRDLALAQKLGINSTPATVIADNRTEVSQLVRAAVINLATREFSH